MDTLSLFRRIVGDLPERLGWCVDAVRQHATIEENWTLNRRQRWWYTLKVIVCLVVGREDNRSVWERSVEEPDHVEVAYADHHPTFHPDFGCGAEWVYLAVGHGIRHGWYFTIGYTGYP